MTRSSIAIAAFLGLVGCTENPEVKLTTTCNAVMSDAVVQRDIRAASISVEDYCACATPALLSLPDTERDRIVGALETMETLMREHNGAEAAFEALSDAGTAADATPEAIASYQAMDELGNRLDDLLDDMKDAGGTCPA